jgi:hypothetical protein
MRGAAGLAQADVSALAVGRNAGPVTARAAAVPVAGEPADLAVRVRGARIAHGLADEAGIAGDAVIAGLALVVRHAAVAAATRDALAGDARVDAGVRSIGANVRAGCARVRRAVPIGAARNPAGAACVGRACIGSAAVGTALAVERALSAGGPASAGDEVKTGDECEKRRSQGPHGSPDEARAVPAKNSKSLPLPRRRVLRNSPLMRQAARFSHRRMTQEWRRSP